MAATRDRDCSWTRDARQVVNEGSRVGAPVCSAPAARSAEVLHVLCEQPAVQAKSASLVMARRQPGTSPPLSGIPPAPATPIRKYNKRVIVEMRVRTYRYLAAAIAERAALV